MKYNKNLKIVAVAVLMISAVHMIKNEDDYEQTEPFATVALSTLDEPIKDGLKTKIFTIVDKSQDIK